MKQYRVVLLVRGSLSRRSSSAVPESVSEMLRVLFIALPTKLPLLVLFLALLATVERPPGDMVGRITGEFRSRLGVEIVEFVGMRRDFFR